MPARLHQCADGPLDVAQNFEISDAPAIDTTPGGFFVCLEPRLARGDAARFERGLAEAPGAHERPGHVFIRIADVREFPVEDGAQTVLVDQHVADAEVAVHERQRGLAFGLVACEPAQGQL